MNSDRLIEELERGERDGREVEVEGLHFTSLDRVLWPREHLTKGDMLRYYVRIAAVMLRYLGERPLMVKRYHEGIEGEAVVQQRASPKAPDGVRTAKVFTAEGEPALRFIGARATLYYLVQMGAVEFHPWHSRLSALDRPDWVIFDLDPSPGAGFKKVVRVAHTLRERIDALGLPETVAADEPSLATVERSVDRRGYRVYIDHLQNARGKTAVAPYSVRARPGAPVSLPIRWDEVDDDLDPRGFPMTEAPERVEREGDEWEGLFRRAQVRRRQFLDARGDAAAAA